MPETPHDEYHRKYTERMEAEYLEKQNQLDSVSAFLQARIEETKGYFLDRPPATQARQRWQKVIDALALAVAFEKSTGLWDKR